MNYKKVALNMLILAAVYYILPLIVSMNGIIWVILVVNPLANLILSYIYTRNEMCFCQTSHLLYGLYGALFIPAVYIYYNSTALVYVFIYIFAAAVGGILARVIKKR
ncbi:hypothetical protein [Ligilactobacillus ceti]|uniref:Uncharacterized protein n=1 Tax=Ligilactobacillus ceti DSM 22408 TaxID=1122146 RepID=A0A0R2KHW1_9LACO|nr:hypothetical protein [Ligilactobacillus ceti]KRN88859.1 hypothetical protein IV53_GL000829 [Ligilactobacillus ceti DSM 22408]